MIAAKQETIDEYRILRNKGYNPAHSLEPFYNVLSYNPDESIHTGFDAFKQYFIE